MVDFHSHILPGMDDGADCVETSLAMLRESKRQGVELICATSHFYADEEDPRSFLARRSEAYSRLLAAMEDPSEYPQILLGAEVLYFPGISVAEEVRDLRLENSPFLLIEPPMMPWSETMLEEVELCGETLRCVPVIAHIDRYMRMLNDYKLFERVKNRRVLVQVNANFFLHRYTAELAVMSLKEKRFQFIGSDCHDMDRRCPNMGDAADVIHEAGADQSFIELNDRLYQILSEGLTEQKA
jgi:protein-tyrosine phosphatase